MSYPRGIDEFTTDELKAELEKRAKSARSGCCDYCDRPFGTKPACKFPERHSGDDTVSAMRVSPAMVNAVRKQTGASFQACRSALLDHDTVEAAVEAIRKQGLA